MYFQTLCMIQTWAQILAVIAEAATLLMILRNSFPFFETSIFVTALQTTDTFFNPISPLPL